MSALARYFNLKGVKVAGYDKTETELTKTLVREGIDIHYTDSLDLIPFEPDLVVYTPAIPRQHHQLSHYKNSNVPVMKRAELLGVISRLNDTVAVAGTHGKTTTSSMTAHILKYCGRDISAFLGGIMTGYETNYFLGQENWVVVEADEYDRSFMHLDPLITIINSMDADHLDIYGNEDSIKEGFKLFLHKTRDEGAILMSEHLRDEFSLKEIEDIKSKYDLKFFGFGDENDVCVGNIRIDNNMVVFDYQDGTTSLKSLKLRMPGKHNILNAAAAITAARMVGVDPFLLPAALEAFEGIKRRFEYITSKGKIYIDDYAHHPSELRSVIAATRLMYAGKKVVGIFQPHLYSRTRDFVNGFAEALDQLDEVILMDIYPAREEPIEGITSEIILHKMKNQNKSLLSVNEIYKKIEEKDFDVLLTLGAGDIDLLVPELKRIIET